MKTESASYLKRVYKAIWEGWGGPEHQAEAFANAILAGDLLGKDMQGMGIAMIIHLMAKHKQVNYIAEPSVQQEGPNYLVINGNRGIGQYVMTQAMEKTIEKAKQSTFGIALVHNWHDIGCASAYTRMALEHDCVGILTVNSVTQTAPWGGRELKMSAPPLSYACPAGEMTPLLGDTSVSGVYETYLSKAVLEGRKLDSKCIVDPETGELTDDPAPYIEHPEHRAAPLLAAPVFPHVKLYVLNVFLEMMTGLLTPGGYTSPQMEYPSMHVLADNPDIQVKRGGGAFLMAINVADLMPMQEFKAKVDEWIRTIKNTKPQKGFDEVLLPGEMALREEQRRLKDGIPIQPQYWEGIKTMAADVGIDVEALR
ncbi:MAG: Ldh family oxidoreductase [Pseudomonadales bacterium]